MASFLMDFSIAHMLPTCYIHGDTDYEGVLLWRIKAERPHLISPGFCESSSQLTGNQKQALCWILGFTQFRISSETVLLCPVPPFW